MAKYNLDPNGLLDTSVELTGITNSIDNALDELNVVVNVLIASNAGGAAEAYGTAQKEWEGGLKQMHEALANASRALNNIHDTYRLGDARGAALFEGNV